MAKSKLEQAMDQGDFNIPMKDLKGMINRAVTSYNKGREMLHFVACAAVHHAKEHGDVTLFHKLLEDMGSRSQTRHRLAAWVRHHCSYDVDGKTKYAMIANINDKGEIRVKVNLKQADAINVQEMYKGPYWDVIKTQQSKTNWELSKSILALVKKAHAEGKDDDTIRLALEEGIKELEKEAA